LFFSKGELFSVFFCYGGWGGISVGREFCLKSFTFKKSRCSWPLQAGGNLQFLVSAAQVGIILIIEITWGGGGSNLVYEVVMNGVNH
jgi:hypothetical protein